MSLLTRFKTMTQPDVTGVAFGSVSQVRETTAELLKLAKKRMGLPFFYCRTRNEGRVYRRATDVGTYGRYGSLFLKEISITPLEFLRAVKKIGLAQRMRLVFLKCRHMDWLKL